MANSMCNWMTADEISRHYVVGGDRLQSYGQRGNLAFRRFPDGVVMYDERDVARFFRKRHVGIAPVSTNEAHSREGASLGVLGVSRLGERTDATEQAPRSRHRRLVRHESHSTLDLAEITARKAAG